MQHKFYQIFLVILLVKIPNICVAQSDIDTTNTMAISLKQVIELSQNNKWIKVSQQAEKISAEQILDAQKGALPSVGVSGEYDRFSGLTLFTHGLSHSTTISRLPNPNTVKLGTEASFNLYAGGRQKSFIESAKVRSELSALFTQEKTGNTKLQGIYVYFDLVRLYDLQKYLNDQLERANSNLKQITALFNNQKVTKNDVLRAEVQVSDVQLSIKEAQNDIHIASTKLQVLLGQSSEKNIVPTDSAGMEIPMLTDMDDFIQNENSHAYSIRENKLNEKEAYLQLKSAKSYNLPTISFTGGYGLNFPNYFYYLPVAQFYSLGYLGVHVGYDISSLYKNKHKVNAIKGGIAQIKLQREAMVADLNQEVKSDYVKYKESLERIAVNKKTIDQSKENLRIVRTKYFNQLALLTELLDADNLYQKSRFDLVKSQTEAFLIYYKIQYTLGNL